MWKGMRIVAEEGRKRSWMRFWMGGGGLGGNPIKGRKKTANPLQEMAVICLELVVNAGYCEYPSLLCFSFTISSIVR